MVIFVSLMRGVRNVAVWLLVSGDIVLSLFALTLITNDKTDRLSGQSIRNVVIVGLER